MTSFVVAIDGPAASGKGTLARRIAIHYGIPHLDTGLTYRAVAKALLDQGLPLDDEAIAADVALNLDLHGMDKAVLSAHAIGEAASKVAVMPAVPARTEAADGSPPGYSTTAISTNPSFLNPSTAPPRFVAGHRTAGSGEG